MQITIGAVCGNLFNVWALQSMEFMSEFFYLPLHNTCTSYFRVPSRKEKVYLPPFHNIVPSLRVPSRPSLREKVTCKHSTIDAIAILEPFI